MAIGDTSTVNSEPVNSELPPPPATSLTASAMRIMHAPKRKGAQQRSGNSGSSSSFLSGTDATISTKNRAWQNDAWDLYNLVGPFGFIVRTIAKRVGQARFYVGELSDTDPTARPEPTKNKEAADALNLIGGPFGYLGQIFQRLALNLSIAGEAWIVGIPRPRPTPEEAAELADPFDYWKIDFEHEALKDATTFANLDWAVYSNQEVTLSKEEGGPIKLTLSDGRVQEYSLDDIYLIRVWQPHPLYANEPDSAVRGCLSVLREMYGYSLHNLAQIDSRLAGGGMLIIPEEVRLAMRQQAGITDPTDDRDPFLESLIDVMTTPLADRDSASAVVPFVVSSPSSMADAFRYLSFATALDEKSDEKRSAAVREFSLGMDVAPEVLLGTSSMNHWGQWLAQEETVKSHLEPILSLGCEALTSQYLHPVLEESGIENPERYVIWYETDHLIIRQNHAADAQKLFDQGVINASALRKANGFDENSAAVEFDAPPEVELALKLISKAPTLAITPGLSALIESIRAALRPAETVSTLEEVLDTEETSNVDVSEVEVSEVDPLNAATGEDDDPDSQVNA